MNNPEFELEMNDAVDVSGYSETRTDKQIDKKDDGGQGVKQFNRITKGTIMKMQSKTKKVEEVVFESKDV